MIRELNDAAERYAEGVPYNQDRHRNCSRDFIAGAEWLASGIWHGMDERPKDKADGEVVKVLFKLYDLDKVLTGTAYIDIDIVGGTLVFSSGGHDHEEDEVEAWCYEKDLLKLLKIAKNGK